MTEHDTRRYEMLTRVRSFAGTYGQLFPDISSAHDAFASVAAEIGHLEALDVAERTASDGSRADRKIAAGAVFYKLLMRARSTARVLEKTIPQLQARIPWPLPKANDLQMLTLARQFATSVAGCGAEFAARGISLAALDAGIAAFEAAVAHRGTSRDARVQARAEREAAFARAMHAVAELDVAVANSIVDPTALAVWKHNRRFDRRRRVSAATAPVTNAPAGPVAVARTETPAADVGDAGQAVSGLPQDSEAA